MRDRRTRTPGRLDGVDEVDAYHSTEAGLFGQSVVGRCQHGRKSRRTPADGSTIILTTASRLAAGCPAAPSSGRVVNWARTARSAPRKLGGPPGSARQRRAPGIVAPGVPHLGASRAGLIALCFPAPERLGIGIGEVDELMQAQFAQPVDVHDHLTLVAAPGFDGTPRGRTMRVIRI